MEQEENKLIDYSEFLEEERVEQKKENAGLKKRKFSLSLSYLKNFIITSDKKTKLEILILIIILSLIIIVLAAYFSQKEPTEVLPPPLPAVY
jgi:hypothetical protein